MKNKYTCVIAYYVSSRIKKQDITVNTAKGQQYYIGCTKEFNSNSFTETFWKLNLPPKSRRLDFVFICKHKYMSVYTEILYFSETWKHTKRPAQYVKVSSSWICMIYDVLSDTIRRIKRFEIPEEYGRSAPF